MDLRDPTMGARVLHRRRQAATTARAHADAPSRLPPPTTRQRTRTAASVA